MPLTPTRKPALLGIVSFNAVALGSAAAYLAAHNWFGAGDLVGFIVWSLLLTLLAYPVLRVFDRWTRNRRSISAYFAAGASGLLVGFVTTQAISLVLGDWIRAFSFPVGLCLVAGSLSAFVASTLVRRPRSWPLALAAVAVPLVSVIATTEFFSARPADLLIRFKPGITSEQIETVFSEVLGVPGPDGRSHVLLDGIQTASRADRDGQVRIRVGFHPGTTVERRGEIVRRILECPFVTRTSDVGASEHEEFSLPFEGQK